MTLDETVVAASANASFSALTNSQTNLANLALANAVSLQQGLNSIFATAIGKMCETMITLDPTESLGVVAAGQQAIKAAGNTPPVTP